MNIKNLITQMLHFFAVCLLLMSFTANAQTLREDASLSDKAEGAPGATKLKAGSSVKVLKRQGFWVEVKNPVDADLNFDWWMVEEADVINP